MQRNVLLSEELGLLGGIDPASYNAGEQLSGPVNLALVGEVLFVLHVGALGGAGTVDAQVKASATAAGTYAAVPGTAITQITTGTGSNVYALIGVRASRLADSNVGPYVKLSVVVGGNAVALEAVAIGGKPHYPPAADQNVAAVKQIVVL